MGHQNMCWEEKALKAEPNMCALGKSQSSHQALQDAVAHWETADRER